MRLRLIVALAVMSAAAAVHVPPAFATAPGFEQFAGCPTHAENPAIEVCTHAVINGGYFEMGNKNVPIKKQMTLSGGFKGDLSGFAANSKGGLTPVKQLVPGGVIGLTGLDWLVNFLSIEALQLYAVTELVGPPTLGETIDLPIRVHLINPVLGNKCYVGSTAVPIQLHLTENATSPPPPNSPISGVPFEFKGDESGILTLNNGTIVDNSFAAPGASGCVLTLFGFIPISINGLVNTASGLPAPAGTNATSQDMDMQLAPSELVYP